jgi:uncharacterized protein YggE
MSTRRLSPVRSSLSRSLTSSFLSWTLFTTIGVVGFTPALPAMAQEPLLRTLTVTGNGTTTVPTTRAQVEVGVEVQGKTAAEVQTAVARRSTAVVELLRSRNVQNLETVGIYLSPQYNYDSGQAQLVGYIGSNTVRFRAPSNEVGPLLDAAITAGATQILGIEFLAEDAAIATARQDALRKAVEDAQRQANTVLSTLNLGAQEIVNIQIDGAIAPFPVPLPAQARLDVAEAAYSPVIGGESTVRASVTLQIRY